MHLTQGLRRAAQLRPNGLAIRDDGVSRSWRDVVDRVARFAGALRALGLGRGDRVAVLALNSARYFEALFAVPWAGGAAVPINTRLAPPEIAYILADSGARILLIDDAFVPVLSALGAAATSGLRAVIHMGDGAPPAGLTAYEALLADAAPAADAQCGGNDLAGIYYTGGTTGQAKGVMLSHGNLVSNAMNVIVCVGYDRGTVYLHAPPMFHLADGCSTFGVTIQGGSHVFLPRFDPLAFLETAARERVTDVTLVPTMINMIINQPRFGEFDLSSFKRIYFGASPMPEAVLRRALALLPHVKFQQAWGMTELSPIGCTMAASMDEDGFVTIVDRLKDMIITGGENVYSAEVESAISLLDGVTEAAVIGVPDEVWGEAVHAVVVPRPGHRLTPEQVIAHCRGLIAGYKCPRSVAFRATPLPLSGAGKVLKTELRAPYWRGRERNVN